MKIFNEITNPLGLKTIPDKPLSTEPRTLEYKFNLDQLIEDIDDGVKDENKIDLVICWKLSLNPKDS